MNLLEQAIKEAAQELRNMEEANIRQLIDKIKYPRGKISKNWKRKKLYWLSTKELATIKRALTFKLGYIERKNEEYNKENEGIKITLFETDTES